MEDDRIMERPRVDEIEADWIISHARPIDFTNGPFDPTLPDGVDAHFAVMLARPLGETSLQMLIYVAPGAVFEIDWDEVARCARGDLISGNDDGWSYARLDDGSDVWVFGVGTMAAPLPVAPDYPPEI
jgi:hypothetical protein